MEEVCPMENSLWSQNTSINLSLSYVHPFKGNFKENVKKNEILRMKHYVIVQ